LNQTPTTSLIFEIIAGRNTVAAYSSYQWRSDIGIRQGQLYYAISPERKIKHPAVQCITEGARETLFAS
jgi:hypothetical protein